MKTSLAVAAVLCFLAPSLAFASGLTPTQVTAVISLLEAFNVSQTIITQVQAELEPQSSVPVIPTTAPNICNGAILPACNSGYTFDCPSSGIGYCAPNVTTNTQPTSGVLNNVSYETITFNQYYENPAAYLGDNITLTGAETQLIPSAGFGSSNYLQLTNLYSLSEPNIEISIPDNQAYTAIVNALQNQYMPTITIDGIGAEDQTFTRTTTYETSDVIVPTITGVSIELCADASSNATYSGSDYASDSSCSDWIPVGG